MDVKGEIDRNTFIVKDFNTPLISMDRSSRQEIKKTVALNNTLDQMHLIDNFRAFNPETEEYTSFSRAHGMFSRIDHMLGNKTSLNKFKRIEIIPSIFSDHNAIKLEINHKKNNKKHAKTNKLNDMLVNNVWVNNKIKEEIKDTLKHMKMRAQQSKICGTLGKQS